jgi:PAS domain S-box-containing protein
VGARPAMPRAAHVGAHLPLASAFFAYVAFISLPLRAWTGVAIYGIVGGAVALLPWLAPRLDRIDRRSLRTRLALILSLLISLPLVAVVSLGGAQLARAVPDNAAWINGLRELSLVALLVLVAAAIGVAIYLARWLTAPLSILTVATARLAAGDATADLPKSRVSEVARLAAAFGEMRERLEERTGQLENVLREQAASALRESEERFRATFEQAPVGVAHVAVDGRWLRFNRRLCEITGYGPDELAGLTFQEITHPDDLATDLALVRRLLDGRIPAYRLEKRYVRKDGTSVWVNLTVSLMREGSGLRYFISIVEDITERKRAEEALRESNDRLQAALGELERAQQQMVQQERLRALGELAAGIAHDFNNSLAMIVGYTELLLADPAALEDRAAARDSLQLVHSAAEDAAAVVGRLREFYRPREKGEDVRPVQLNDVIARAISLTEPRWRDQAQAGGRTIHVETDFGDVPPVAGLEAELREALANLILNAVDAMPSGGTLTLRTRMRADRVVVEVRDTGVGMPPEVLARLFEPFFTTKGDRGTGLGLPMVHGIVERHEGHIEVDSAPGAGTTFTISLPASRAGAPASPAPDASPAAVPALRVLVVEDEPSLRRILASYLEVDGHTVRTTANGREAIDAFRRERFDLVITDRAMPDVGGDRLAAALGEVAPDVPVVMVTGLGALMNDVGERPAGVDLVVAKPVTLGGLRAAVREVVGRRGANDCRRP